jgi:hypothetical protein
MELLKQTTLVIWDEFFSNDKRLFEAVVSMLREKRTNIVFVVMGDLWQILPIVKGGNASDTIRATFISSLHWEYFTKFRLSKNMRILAASENITEDSSEEDRLHLKQQVDYARSILAIGEGVEGNPIQIGHEHSFISSDCCSI